MGSGIDAARAAGADVHADVMESFRDQLIIVLLKRLAKPSADGQPELVIPVAETDDTGNDLLLFSVAEIDGRLCFRFELRKKS